jgi:titin
MQNSSGVVGLGNGGFGVEFENGANNGSVAGDVISGQTGIGVVITGSGTMDNLVGESEIGTDPSGMTGVDEAGHSLANTEGGVAIMGAASNNTVDEDVISNNGSYGVNISGATTSCNLVERSMIGTNSTGTAALPNFNGVIIQGGASGNAIGAPIPGTGASVTQAPAATSGSATQAPPTTSSTAQAAATTLTHVPAVVEDVVPYPSALDADGDVISGNAWEGVHIAGSSGNVVEGDYIGLSLGGSAALGNAESGVGIYAGASDNTIGGSASGTGDVISGNGSNGVYITDGGTTANVVEGDFIGTDSTGSNRLPNSGSGVVIQDGASDNTIGGTATLSGGSLAGAGDVISGNDWDGVHIVNCASDNVVEGDYIGTNALGNAALGNAQSGVAVFAGATTNIIGAAAAGAGDVLSGNGVHGVYISDSGTTGNVVAGDLIGTDSTGSYSVPNYVGVLIQNGAAQNTIGGITSTVSDVISGNSWDGVQILWGATQNVVEGDFIGLALNGQSSLGNGASGVSIYGGASNNTIGGTAAGTLDLIEYNAQNGVYMGGSGTSGNIVDGVYIVYNANNGVQLDPGSTQNMIANDILADNGASGVYFAASSYDNSVTDCVIENNAWGIYDAGSGDSNSGNVVVGNPKGNYVQA